MKRGKFEGASWAVVLVIGLVLALRLGRVVSQSETGMQTLLMGWRDGTVGLWRERPTPLVQRYPAEQAGFWLRETKRLEDHTSKDARLAIGAALVLDNASPGYANRLLTDNDMLGGGVVIPEQSTFDRLGVLEESFESSCGKRSQQLVRRAIELEPSTAEWWRLRALLLWGRGIYFSPARLRVANWREVLDECARHDPENALYDYLAADYCWRTSIDSAKGDGDRLVVRDQRLFDEGERFFLRAQSRQYLAIGDASYPAVVEFLRRSRAPLADQPTIARTRTIQLRGSSMLADLWRNVNRRASAAAERGDWQAALALHRQNLRLVEQCAAGSSAVRHSEVFRAIRISTIANILSLARENETLLAPAERRRFEDLEQDAKLEQQIAEEAAARIDAALNRRFGSPPGVTAIALVRGMLIDVLLSGAVVFWTLGIAAVCVTRRKRDARSSGVGWLGQGGALATAATVSFLVFGLLPAADVHPDVQNAVAWGLVLLGLIAVLPCLGYQWLRGRDFRFTLRSMLGLMVAIGVVSAIVSRTHRVPAWPAIRHQAVGGVDPMVVRAVLATYGNGLWSLFQWVVHRGHLVAIGLWCAILASFVWLKSRRQVGQTAPADSGNSQFTSWCRAIGPAAFRLGALSLLIYLWLVADVVTESERRFQREIGFVRSPVRHWSSLESEMKQIRSETRKKAELKAMDNGAEPRQP